MVSKRPQNTAAPRVPENPTIPKLRTAAAQALFDDETRHRETERFIADLKHVHEVLDKHKIV